MGVAATNHTLFMTLYIGTAFLKFLEITTGSNAYSSNKEKEIDKADLDMLILFYSFPELQVPWLRSYCNNAPQ